MARLVEILARHLLEWPEHACVVVQDKDRELKFSEVSGPYFEGDSGVWIRGGSLGFHEDGRIDDLAEDHATAIVTRAEWQAAVEALKKSEVVEWDGSGLPPVGGPYEYNDNFAWCACDVIAYANGKVVFTRPDYAEAAYVAGCDEISFRPIRTPEQIAAKERQKGIGDICQAAEERITEEVAGLIFDAGYRKQEPK